VCQAIEIPFCVVIDEDICPIDPTWSEKKQFIQKEDNAKHAKWNMMIEESVNKMGNITYYKRISRRSADFLAIAQTRSIGPYDMFASIEADLVPIGVKGVIEQVIALKDAGATATGNDNDAATGIRE